MRAESLDIQLCRKCLAENGWRKSQDMERSILDHVALYLIGIRTQPCVRIWPGLFAGLQTAFSTLLTGAVIICLDRIEGAQDR